MPQKKVYQNQAFAIHGGQSNYADPEVFCHPTFRALPGGTAVLVGGFFWKTTAPEGASLEYQDQAWAQGSGSGVPDGFAGYQPTYQLPSNFTGTLTVPEGATILGLVKTSRYVVFTGSAPTVGQKAFATLATGAVVFGNAGATISGAIETNFVVKQVISGQAIINGTETAATYVEISNFGSLASAES